MEHTKITNAYLLYIKLYCKRKGNTKRNRRKARRSWVSLSPVKRKLFYKTACHTNMIKCAQALSKAEPYLKEKCPRKNDNTIVELNTIDDQTPSTVIEHNVSVISTSESQTGHEPLAPIADDFMEYDDVNSVSTDRNQTDTELEEPLEPEPQNCETNVQHEIARTSESRSAGPQTQTRLKDICDAESESETYQDANAPLIEPTPPRATSSKELYNLLKGPGAPDWKNIDSKEKIYYAKALRPIKLNYVKEYTKYLESLSHQQLCELYIKTFH